MRCCADLLKVRSVAVRCSAARRFTALQRTASGVNEPLGCPVTNGPLLATPTQATVLFSLIRKRAAVESFVEHPAPCPVSRLAFTVAGGELAGGSLLVDALPVSVYLDD